jgi:multiple sugar transport system permease protein
MIVLATIMISFEAIVVPLFILVRRLGMQNTYWGLIIPESLTAFGVFMIRQFFFSLPNDYIESARIDGANEFVIFGRIAIPMAQTALLALVIFHAQWVWNLLLWPLIVMSDPDMRVLPQGIALFKGGYNTPYPEQLAVSVIACIPLLLLYMFLSKYFVQGIAMTGLKG